MKNKVVRILALVIVLSMIFTTAAFAAPKHKRFEHFNKKYEKYELKMEDYEEALKSLINKKIVKGYGNGDYGLSGNVKRGDVVVMIIRMLEEYDELDLSVSDIEDVFDDVYRSDYFYDSIKKAHLMGIAKGDGKHFNPNKPVTTQEAIWLIERAAEFLDDKSFDLDVEAIDELEEIYEDSLNKFAKRQDVFWMLYYVLDMVEVDDIDDEDEDFLKYTIDINDVLEFDDDVEEDIKAAFAIDTTNNLEEIKFELSSRLGAMYFDFDEDEEEEDRDPVPDTKFSAEHIDDITFVPKRVGEVEIKYIAYDKYGHDYSETIVIIVEEDDDENKVLPLIKKNMDENSLLKLDEEFFEDYLDKVEFILPDDGDGILYNRVKHSDGMVDFVGLTDKNRTFDYKDLGNIYFEPVQDETGKVTIEYIGYDGDVEYTGEIIITVKERHGLKTLNWKIDEDVVKDYELDFESKLYDIDASLDDVEIDNPIKGKLSIKYDDVYTNIDEDDNYILDDIEKMFYHPEGEGPIYVYYTAFDGSKSYDGAIRVFVVD